jgi:hypothetical protein
VSEVKLVLVDSEAQEDDEEVMDNLDQKATLGSLELLVRLVNR